VTPRPPQGRAAAPARAEAIPQSIDPRRLTDLRRRLLLWYERHRRPLPWRRTRDPYRIWVSEVMLQQTQVGTVIPYYGRFIERFADIGHLARAGQQEVLKLWEGLGYYARARNFHRAAMLVAERHGGRVPGGWDEFRNLPGVGDYIAAAVLSIAFDQPFAVVDGNVKRVLARLFAMDTPVNAAGSERVFHPAAGMLLDRLRPGTFNQAVMELGALVCTPRNPDCGGCPLACHCRVRKEGAEGRYPLRLARAAPPEVAVAVGVVFKNGRVLITRRPPVGLLGGLWEFPGGKVMEGERPEETCVREIREEVNLRIAVEAPLARVRHRYTHLSVVMDVFRCRHLSGRVRLKGPEAHRWIRIAEIPDYPFPRANHKFIPLLTLFATEGDRPSAEG
jgi:A/G-specific adenine glycosylase